MTDAANADQINYWNEAVGETWAALQMRMDAQLAPLGDAAVEALAPQAGERLLDVGCGCGATTFQLAEAVGASGHVTGVDISRPMLAVARERGAPAEAAPTDFEEADAQTHAFPPGTLDGVFSRFGVMFFADPVAAFANLKRALKPGGRLAFVAWRAMADNPMFTAPMTAVLAHIPPPPPPEPNAPGPFGLADPERTRRLLSEAGFSDVDVRACDRPISPGPLEGAMDLILRVGPLGALLREHPEAADAAMGGVRVSLAGYMQGEQVVFPAAVWIVTARA